MAEHEILHVPKKVILMLPLVLVLLAAKTTSQPTNDNGLGCLRTCGSISVPFPFGTSPGCYYDETFLVTCNQTSTSTTSKLFFPRSNVSILEISLETGELRVESPIARDCYNQQGNLTNTTAATVFMFSLSKFPISSSKNVFASIGCDSLSVIVGGSQGRSYTSGCLSLCEEINDVVNGSCSGVGCCQMSMPEDVVDFGISLGSLYNHSKVWSFNRCGYAFVVEDSSYNFSSVDLSAGFQNRETVPVVLDWAVGNMTCQEAAKENSNVTEFACRASYSECLDSSNGSGYRCKCSEGFEGNPYLLDGCRDINECERSTPCVTESRCNNMVGNFSCSCPDGFQGDGRINGTRCNPVDDRDAENQSTAVRLSIALGISIGFLLLLLSASWMYWVLKKKKLVKLKEKFFQQNGGLLLQQQLVHQRGTSSETAKIFTAEQLKKATNNYDESRVLGQGGYGTVYKGVFPDNKVVAIKKSKIGNQSQIEQFINEVIVLSQINHRNVVKLLGCCLETEVPLLVYEFITNGTLSDHIHNHKDEHNNPSLSWEMRLKIAAETAGAIAYLHSSTSMPIIHRDVKTTNILLDEKYTAKVSDFGASRLVPLDQTQLTTLVQGTLGYLDPEYFQTSQLTEKSDVYSFGVVLAELLTGEKAISFDRGEYDRNLAMYFISSIKEDRLVQVLDQSLVVEGKNIEQIKEVANLAKCCLRVKGEDRPTMKEVASELEGLVRYKGGIHPWRKIDDHDLTSSEETQYLLKPNSDSYHFGETNMDSGNSNSIATAGFDSMSIQILKPYDGGDGR